MDHFKKRNITRIGMPNLFGNLTIIIIESCEELMMKVSSKTFERRGRGEP